MDTGTDPITPVSGLMSDMNLAVGEAIEAIRPVIQMDGGDIALVSCDEESGVVTVELSGACVGCPASSMTLKAGVERILMDRVPGVTEVRALGVDADMPVEA
jgi:Fe-S cluster biogenesis protein NfuA